MKDLELHEEERYRIPEHVCGLEHRTDEAETLLQQCQREAREAAWDLLDEDGAELLNEIIANTLKQAAEALEGMKKSVKDLYPEATLNTLDEETAFQVTYKEGHNRALTDAQKILGVDLSE